MTSTKVIPIVQNVDRNVSMRDYSQLNGDLLVTSFFSTIQGEGPFAGRPAMFVRLAGCNFGSKTDRCQWCDTSFQFDSGERYTDDGLLFTLLNQPSYKKSQVLVITGGEPTLQLALIPFIKKAAGHFADIQLESNGTQPKFYIEAVKQEATPYFKTVVSPKPSIHGYSPLPQHVLWWASCLKFVLSADPESPHHTVPSWVKQCGVDIYVSPMAVYSKAYTGEVSSIWDEGLIDKEATRKNYSYAAEYAMQHGLMLSLQTHLFLDLP